MEAIAMLLEPHVPALRRFAFSLTRDRDLADDLVQVCLERALNRWSLRHQGGHMRAWLFTILRNLFIDHVRRVQRRGVHVALEDASYMPVGADQHEMGLSLRDVLAGLDSLPEDQSSAILLISVEDLSYADAARVLGVPVGTLMSRLSRGREKLRTLLGDTRPPLRF